MRQLPVRFARKLLRLRHTRCLRCWRSSRRRLRCSWSRSCGRRGRALRSGSLLGQVAVRSLNLARLHICLCRLRVRAFGLGVAGSFIQLRASRWSLLFYLGLRSRRRGRSGLRGGRRSHRSLRRCRGRRELSACGADEKSERSGCSRDAHCPAIHCFVHGVDLQWLVPV